jgi:tellurite resistance protein TehA-like permease
VSKVVRLTGFAALFAAGALLAVAIGRAQDVTTTETTTTVETMTAPGTTVVSTETVQQTTTRRVVVPTAGTTTSGSNDEENVPVWAWVLIGALALALLILLVVLLSRRGGRGVPLEERRRRLDSAVSSWLAQGWALESQSADSAVLRRGNELMLVGIDPAGYVTTRPVMPGQ